MLVIERKLTSKVVNHSSVGRGLTVVSPAVCRAIIVMFDAAFVHAHVIVCVHVCVC